MPSSLKKVQREYTERFDTARSLEAILTSLQDTIDHLHVGEASIGHDDVSCYVTLFIRAVATVLSPIR